MSEAVYIQDDPDLRLIGKVLDDLKLLRAKFSAAKPEKPGPKKSELQPTKPSPPKSNFSLPRLAARDSANWKLRPGRAFRGDHLLSAVALPCVRTMAAKIGVLQADQSLSETPQFHVKRSDADRYVRQLLARRVSKHLIQLLVIHSAAAIQAAAPSFTDGPFGVGNLLPFTKSHNPLKKPERLHYEIPACGAHGRRLSVFRTNHGDEAEAEA